jgi:hypothetical protein
MKKFSSMLLAIVVSFYGIVALSPVLVQADSGHGNKNNNHGSVVSAVARSHSSDNESNHGSIVSAVAKDNHGQNKSNEEANENENKDNNENEHGTTTSPTATSTLDTTPPIILFTTNLGLKASTTSLIWVTNESSNSKIWFSTTQVATSTTPLVSSGTLSFFHQLSLPNLATSTLYFYTISSTDAFGNTGYYSNSFTTPAI